MTLTDDDLHGQIEIVQAGAPQDQLFNSLRGQYIAAGRGTPSDFDPYQNSAFVTADGEELWSDVALPWTDSKARARNLARIFTERNRDGLVIRYPAKLRAWPLQVGDRVTVTSAEYGFSSKTFRVTDWQFGLRSAVVLTLQEDAAAVYDLADAATADPAPNTGLPSPWVVAALTGISALSDSTTVLHSTGSAIVPRVLVSWDAVTDAYVTDGSGRIEVIWRRPGGPYEVVSVPGDSTSAYVVGPNHGDILTMGVRAINGLGQAGPWAWFSHTVDGALSVDAGGNLLRNSSFEADIDADGLADSWTAYSAGTTGTITYSQINSGAIHGTYKQRFSGSGLGTGTGDRIGAYQAVVVSGGQPYILSVWGSISAGTPKLRLYIDWYDASVSFISGASSLFTPTATLTRFSLSADAPATAAYARAYIWMEDNGSVTLATMDIDAAQFQPGTVLTGHAPREDDILSRSVDTPQLADNAATELAGDSDTTVSTTLGAGAGGSQTPVAFYWENTLGFDVTVEVGGAANFTVTNTNGTGTTRVDRARLTIQEESYSGSWSFVAERGEANYEKPVPDIAASGVARFQHARTQQVVVPAGRRIRVAIDVQVTNLSGAACTIVSRDPWVSAAVIKR
jgi:hypothetical protein